MPELPEVETVKRGLQQTLKAKPRIEEFKFLRRDLRDPMPVAKLKALKGARIVDVQRRAKYLLFKTEKGDFLSHLGMTGTWRSESAGFVPQKHDHVQIHLENKTTLIYRDPRRFGILDIADSRRSKKRLEGLGPEPWDAQFTAEYLFELSRGRKQAVKGFLMDQAVVVGVGNIYASEALFLAGIRPAKHSGLVKKTEYANLVKQSQLVLEKAIAAGGSSISDFYSFGGLKGGFQDLHLVYDRSGDPCPTCNTLIKNHVICGRNSFWCPKCQK